LSQLSQLSPSPSSSARSRTNMCTRLAGWPRPWRSLWRGGPVAARVVALPNQGSDESRTADAMHRKVPRKTTRLQAGNALVGDVFGCAARKPALHQGRAARVHHCEEAAQSTVAGRQSVQVRLHALGVLEQVLRGRRITGQPHAIHHRSQIASSDLSGAPTPRQRRPRRSRRFGAVVSRVGAALCGGMHRFGREHTNVRAIPTHLLKAISLLELHGAVARQPGKVPNRPPPAVSSVTAPEIMDSSTADSSPSHLRLSPPPAATTATARQARGGTRT
jgi:hypothetical protein